MLLSGLITFIIKKDNEMRNDYRSMLRKNGVPKINFGVTSRLPPTTGVCATLCHHYVTFLIPFDTFLIPSIFPFFFSLAVYDTANGGWVYAEADSKLVVVAAVE